MDWSPSSRSLSVRSSLSITNQSDDPRIGSGRNGSTGGTISHVTSSGTNSSSASSLGSTFVPVLIYSAVCLAIFLTCRRKHNRVYAPRTIKGLRPYGNLSPELPNGWFNWIVPFFKIPDTFILNNCSLDGYFFLRFIKVIAIICFTGCFLAWPILLSVNGTGGNKMSQLDILTIGNVLNPIRFYAHVAIAWIFFGFILYMICRECIFYINLRQAYLLSPDHAHRLSARTVLFTCVPKRFLNERRVRKLFGESVKNVWIPRNTKALQRLVEDREKTAIRLEVAEIELIKKTHKARKAKMGNEPIPLLDSPAPTGSKLGPSRTATSISIGASSSASSPSSFGTSASTTTTVSPVSPPTGESLSQSSSNATDGRPSFGSGRKAQLEVREAPAHSHHGFVSESPSSPSATIVVAEPISSVALSDGLGDPKGKATPTKLTLAEITGDADVNEEDYTHPYGYAMTLPDVRGSVAAQWLPAKDRPRHRPLGNYGRSVDTIRWTRMRLKDLNKAIARSRRRLRAGDGTPLSALFVEFDSQAAAQLSFQALAHHQPLHMSPRFIGIRPEDVIWPSLRMRWWERIIRRFLIMGAVSAAIIFWSIPSAMVGVVSNVEFLSSKVFFLHWIADLPGSITGVIQGLLPSVALSLLMAIVPFALRAAARTAGVPSATMVELFTQHAYFVFQVVQVFLVTTLTSAASAAFTKILEDPLSTKDLLSQNLPKASNFYLSYITVQCLAGGASGLVHLLDLFRHGVVFKTVEHPRRAHKIWHKLKQPHWGSVFPVYTNMGVIAISYACIAPLILAFAGLGMCASFCVYRYNLIYFYDTDLDSKGLHYPRALMHLMVGLYMAEVCLIGLFSIQAAIGPVALMVVFLIFTILVHLSLNDAVNPLLYSLPRTLTLEDEDLAGDDDEKEDEDEAEHSHSATGLASDYYDIEEAFGEEEQDDNLHAGPQTSRGIDGARDLMGIFSDWTKSAIKEKIKSEAKNIRDEARSSRFARFIPWLSPESAAAAREEAVASRDGLKRVNFFKRWLHPEIYEDYLYLKTMLPTETPEITYPEDYARRGYWPPEMWKPIPKLWIPQDEARVSRQEVAHTGKILPISDRGAWLTPKGRVVVEIDKAPFNEPKIVY